MKRPILVLLIALLALPPALHAQDGARERIRERVAERRESARQKTWEEVTIAGLDAAVWRPDPALSSLRPLVIFSHGFMGCKTQSTFLMEALAARSYFAVAPDHADASCGSGRVKPEERFRDPDSWTPETYKSRGEDIRRLLDALKQDKRFSLYIDWNRVGLAGHSLGGYTVLGLGGAWPGWKLADAKAVLALSPYANPFMKGGGLAGMDIPVMYQTGTRDYGIGPFVKRDNGAFAQTSTPAYFVEFDGAGHFAWTDRPAARDYHANIIAYSLWFFDRYLGNSGIPFPGGGPGVAAAIGK